MKTVSLVKKIENAGFKVEVNGRTHTAKGDKYAVSFTDQDGSAICIHVCRHGDVSDSMTDYFAGFFVETAKRAVQCLQEKKAA